MTIDAGAQDASPVTLAGARAEFDAEVTYLDTATFGLPPRRSWAALQQALAQWRAGTADAVAYDLPLAAARASYARLAGVDPSVVAVGSQVSVFAGLIAANLPDGSEVLTATGSARAGRLRLSFHVSTSDQDADLAADVLRRHVTSRHPATL